MIGLGCMRLSTAVQTDEVARIGVIHAALHAGALLLDTADAYAPDGNSIGHNERLIAASLATWKGDVEAIEVATKGGLTRPGGRWVPDGRAKSLRSACEASLSALGVPRLALYQLHAVDPRTPLETSIRALAELQKDGLIECIGLCNVTVGQIEAARRITDITTVQVSLGPFDEENFRNGVAEYCRDENLRLLGYRPLGGADRDRCRGDPVLTQIAAQHGVTPHEIALAWLLDLDPCVVPLPGATQVSHASLLARVNTIRLTGSDRDRLDTRFPAGRLLRVPRSARRPVDRKGDVVIVMGMPGAGKSTIARTFITQGYGRLNRDERGGRLADLASTLDDSLRNGRNRWVLDNTYVSRRSRNEIIECAWRHHADVRCIHLDTSVADAQINAILRMLEAHGRLPTPDEIRSVGKQDHRFFGPDAQFRYERTFEAPSTDEGFSTVDVVPFERTEIAFGDGRAVVMDADAVLGRITADRAGGGREADAIPPSRIALLRRYRENGWSILATAWRPEIAAGAATASAVTARFESMREMLGLDVTFAFCPHPPGPPVCWCRKPLPGLVLEFLWNDRIDPRSSRMIATSAPDRTMASRLRMDCVEMEDFLARTQSP
jgi:aryl-alcohol dehydrogenase-like predicted oxidoreductase/predicted kinase